MPTENGFEVAGPIVNVYWNMAVKGVPHYLEIWLPVKKKDKAAIKTYKVVEPYRCLTHIHKDGLELMGEAWGEFGKLAQGKKTESTGQDREVYLNLDFENPKLNVIELQMGIR
jgi:effector-binding domain-containing protein